MVCYGVFNDPFIYALCVCVCVCRHVTWPRYQRRPQHTVAGTNSPGNTATMVRRVCVSGHNAVWFIQSCSTQRDCIGAHWDIRCIDISLVQSVLMTELCSVGNTLCLCWLRFPGSSLSCLSETFSWGFPSIDEEYISKRTRPRRKRDIKPIWCSTSHMQPVCTGLSPIWRHPKDWQGLVKSVVVLIISVVFKCFSCV